jgi:hypothetical protein
LQFKVNKICLLLNCLIFGGAYRGIPFFKPFGKVNYFDRLEIISWLKQNRVATTKELDIKASTFVTLKNGGAK